MTVCLYKRLGIWENSAIMGLPTTTTGHCTGLSTVRGQEQNEAWVCSGVLCGQATGVLRPVVFLEPRPCVLSFTSPFVRIGLLYTPTLKHPHSRTHVHSHTPTLTVYSHSHLHSHAHIHSLSHTHRHTHILTETPCPPRRGWRERNEEMALGAGRLRLSPGAVGFCFS